MSSQESLVKELIRGGYLKNPDLIAAFQKIDRADFVPENLKKEAYFNEPLAIGFDQTISQPLTVAFMLELLEPKPEEKILDIGAGSSWVSALLAQVVGEKGKIIAVEIIPELCEFGRQNLAKYNFIEKGIVKLVCADGSRGYPPEYPYDKIIASATTEEIPLAWREELKIGGRLVAPQNHSIVVWDKINREEFEKKEFFGFSFVPLVKEK